MTGPSPPILRLDMRDVRKRYGATIALNGVDLKVAPGEVHAVLGENGAGKSTLMKILAGAVQPDSGFIAVDGRPVALRHPREARNFGVAMIHQELCVAPHLSVEANLALGAEDHALGVLRMRDLRSRATGAFSRLGRPDIRLHARVGSLAPGSRQIVEIARALVRDARLLILDEPTSSLGLHEISRLLDVIATLKSQRVSVIYISHQLDEVMQVADRFTVLRDGRVIRSGEMRQTTGAELVECIVGEQTSDLSQHPSRGSTGGSAPGLVIRGVSGRTLPADANLRLSPGEVLGIAGLVGSGRTELLRAVFGLDLLYRGDVVVGGRPIRKPTPARMLRHGVGLLSEDRAHEGLALNMSVAANVTLGGLADVSSRLGVINGRAEREAACRLIDVLQIRTRTVSQPVRELSGGNQQKVALARLLHRDVQCILLDQPTRGIDVAARAQIARVIGKLAAVGKSIIVVSDSASELLEMCDRVAVMRRGRLVATRRSNEWDVQSLLHACMSDDAAIAVGGDADAA